MAQPHFNEKWRNTHIYSDCDLCPKTCIYMFNVKIISTRYFLSFSSLCRFFSLNIMHMYISVPWRVSSYLQATASSLWRPETSKRQLFINRQWHFTFARRDSSQWNQTGNADSCHKRTRSPHRGSFSFSGWRGKKIFLPSLSKCDVRHCYYNSFF